MALYHFKWHTPDAESFPIVRDDREAARTMHLREFLAQRKAHLIFGSAFLLVLILNATINVIAGETVLGAVWKSISKIKPLDYIMFALFWYACTVHRPKDDWRSPLITLGLG